MAKQSVCSVFGRVDVLGIGYDDIANKDNSRVYRLVPITVGPDLGWVFSFDLGPIGHI